MKFVRETDTHYPQWLEKDCTHHIVTGSNDSYKKLGKALIGGTYPIVGVSWIDAMAYSKWLSELTGSAFCCRRRLSGSMPPEAAESLRNIPEATRSTQWPGTPRTAVEHRIRSERKFQTDSAFTICAGMFRNGVSIYIAGLLMKYMIIATRFIPWKVRAGLFAVGAIITGPEMFGARTEAILCPKSAQMIWGSGW